MVFRKFLVLVAVVALMACGIAQANINVDRNVASFDAYGGLTIDGDPSDWNLGVMDDPITADLRNPADPHGARTPVSGTGDYAMIGWDDAGKLYYTGSWTGATLPVNQADHSAGVFTRDNATTQYFLAWVLDDEVNTGFPLDQTWANDCVEFYIDPANAASPDGISGSTSEIQLVIDAGGQRNVYMTTAGYKDQILAGLTSAVVQTGNGFIIEAALDKAALDPDLPASLGNFGLGLAFRDNDDPNNTGALAGDTAFSTMYSWADTETSGGFPSKIPIRWGNVVPEPATLALLAFGALFLRRRS